MMAPLFVVLFYFWETKEVFDHLASFLQVERRLHDRELNRQLPHLVWVPIHYHPVV